MDLTKRFDKLLLEIDSIFVVPKTLKEIYLKALESIDQAKLNHTQKNGLSNTTKLLANISSNSIASAEKHNLSKLYAQSIILVVSNAEWLLKISFEILLEIYIVEGEPIDKIDKLSIPFRVVRERELEVKKEDWIEIIQEKFEEEKNPEEKLNFQNIQSVKNHFKTYLDIELLIPDNLQKKIHLYYQIRHLLVHKLGIVDKRFINNLNQMNIKHSYELGKRIILTDKDYEDCKTVFREFFALTEAAAENGIQSLAKRSILRKTRSKKLS